MSTTTSNLGLFKYDITDHTEAFNYQTALNDNWDKIDAALNFPSGTAYTATCPAITISEGAATWNISHNLGTQNIVVSLYNSSGAEINKDVLVTSDNTVSISFKASSNVIAGSYKIVVLANGGEPINPFSIQVQSTAGQIATTGSGVASVKLYSNGFAEIHYTYRITTQGSSASDFNWALSASAIHSLNSNIPLIVPMKGGSCLIFSPQGAINYDTVGYGAYHEVTTNYWVPSRVTTAQGSVGAWPANTLPVNWGVMGVAFGTYTI